MPYTEQEREQMRKRYGYNEVPARTTKDQEIELLKASIREIDARLKYLEERDEQARARGTDYA